MQSFFKIHSIDSDLIHPFHPKRAFANEVAMGQALVSDLKAPGSPFAAADSTALVCPSHAPSQA